ncbi:MAG TPA: PQQ-binding-like beta-propeller repeat protein, partial [Planctomycetota bacterium]|nr:PQQ-binding-like beta-propeller repeat protein [Planctomycetota bacterium]
AGRPRGSPAVVALHHPPFPGGGKRFLANEEALLHILRARGARLILAGHGHDLRRWSVGGVEVLMTPNLYAESARWRRVRVEADRFVVENRSLGSERTEEEEPIPFRAPEGADPVPAPIDVAPGEWNVETPATSLRAVAVSGERAYVAGTEGVLAVHSLARGELLRTLSLEAPAHASPVVAGDRVIVASEAGTVAALRPTDLSTIWEARLGGAVVMTPAADAHRLFVGSGDGRLHALALADGRTLWSFGAERHFGPPAAGNDRVFAGNWDGHVYALAAPDGRLLWKRKVHDSFYFAPGTSRPAPAGDLVVVTFAVPTKPPDAPSLLALRADTGEVAWSLRIPAGYASPLVVEDRVYLSTTEGEVVAVDRSTGTVRWKRDLGSPCFDSSPALVPGGIAV